MAHSIKAPTSGGEAKARGEQAARSKTFERLARAGMIARAVIYGVIAVLALEVAFGSGGKTTNQQGALQEIAQGSFGKVLLVLVAIGLAGYAIWRLMRAAIGHGKEDGSEDAKERISSLISGIAYAGLCVTAIQILAGSGGGGGGAKSTTGGVLGWPGGQFIVGIAGLLIIGAGIDQARRAYKKSFLKHAKTEEMDEKTCKAYTRLGQAGYGARAVVFVMIGYFVLRAAIDFDPDKAVSLDGALAKLAHAPLGPLALGLVALGLLAFGVYSAFDARYRKV
jgi:Domain of Unknown Function (DUF1206)